MARNKDPVVADVLAAALTWLFGFAVLTFIVDILRMGSFEAGFREWGFSTWEGAVISTAAALCFGMTVTLTKRWRDHRREKKRCGDQSD